MKITKYGHACLLIEENDARLLIDPGAYSHGFENLTGLSAVLITHQHPDHLVPDTLVKLLERNPDLKIYADKGSAEQLAGQDIAAEAVEDGRSFDVNGVNVGVIGHDHAVIHPDMASIPNVGYLIAERLFYPGDNFTHPGKPVEILATPAAAPWSKLSETIDYVRAVKPKTAIPVHDAVLSDEGRQIHFQALGQGDTDVRVIKPGETLDL